MLPQIKKELNSYRHDLQNIENRKYQCAFNSIAFIVQSGFKYNQLHVTGHAACINNTALVDPTCGCVWFYEGSYVNLIKSILKDKKKPDHCTDWFDKSFYSYFWDYAFKYEENIKQGTLPNNWNIPIQIVVSTFRGIDATLIGKYSDYV